MNEQSPRPTSEQIEQAHEAQWETKQQAEESVQHQDKLVSQLEDAQSPYRRASRPEGLVMKNGKYVDPTTYEGPKRRRASRERMVLVDGVYHEESKIPEKRSKYRRAATEGTISMEYDPVVLKESDTKEKVTLATPQPSRKHSTTENTSENTNKPIAEEIKSAGTADYKDTVKEKAPEPSNQEANDEPILHRMYGDMEDGKYRTIESIEYVENPNYVYQPNAGQPFKAILKTAGNPIENYYYWNDGTIYQMTIDGDNFKVVDSFQYPTDKSLPAIEMGKNLDVGQIIQDGITYQIKLEPIQQIIVSKEITKEKPSAGADIVPDIFSVADEAIEETLKIDSKSTDENEDALDNNEFKAFQNMVLMHGLVNTKRMLKREITAEDYEYDAPRNDIEGEDKPGTSKDKVDFLGTKMSYEQLEKRFGVVAAKIAFEQPISAEDYRASEDFTEAARKAGLSPKKEDAPKAPEESRLKRIREAASRIVSKETRTTKVEKETKKDKPSRVVNAARTSVNGLRIYAKRRREESATRSVFADQVRNLRNMIGTKETKAEEDEEERRKQPVGAGKR